MKLLSTLHWLRITSGWLGAGFAIVHLWANQAAAQTAVPQIPTTVQLPTFHYFTTDSSVLVPDGGDAFLGGVGSSAAGRTEQGIPGLPSRPFTNTATGASTGASNVSVSAQIHDFEAMDKALLGEAASGEAFHPPLAARQQLTATRLDADSLQNIAAIRAQQAAEDAAHDQQAAAALERGRQLQAAGKVGVAKIYFESAARQSIPRGEVHQQAVAALAALEQANGSGKVAGR